MSDITSQNLTELIKNIKDKKISSEEVTKSFVEKAEKARTLNCYITEDFDSAINKAKKFDSKPNFNCKLPGIPIAVKDLFCTDGVKTTAGSKILNNFKKKISFDPTTEFDQAIKQVKQIASLRLKELDNKGLKYSTSVGSIDLHIYQVKTVL